MANIGWVSTTGPEDWNNPATWVGGAVPTAADSAVLVSPPTHPSWALVAGGANVSVVNATLVDAGLVVGGTPAFGGAGVGHFTATGIIADYGNNIVGSTGSSITADAGFVLGDTIAALGGGGTFNGPIYNQGIVDADGADYGLGPLIINSSTIESPPVGATPGTGYIRVGVGSTLELNSPTSETLLVDYSIRPGATTGTATLDLDQPATFKGILDVAALNTLDLFLAPGQTVSGATVANNTLTVTSSTGVDTFALAGANLHAAVLNPGSPTTRAELVIGPNVAGSSV